jgi:hypothetical protein
MWKRCSCSTLRPGERPASRKAFSRRADHTQSSLTKLTARKGGIVFAEARSSGCREFVGVGEQIVT